MANCKSCGAAIDWAVDPAGKRIPVDTGQREDGTLAVQPLGGGALAVRYMRKGSVLSVDEYRAVSHYATCPDAKAWRERGSASAVRGRGEG
jgi:hypothetical protein